MPNRYRVKYKHDPPPNPIPGENYTVGAGIWSANIRAHDIDDARHQILKNFPYKRADGKIVNRIIVSCRKIYY
tara:strand:+ start:4506 stop:4724 length:219 start_codon:yes stop_codon:yes gene_type:complete